MQDLKHSGQPRTIRSLNKGMKGYTQLYFSLLLRPTSGLKGLGSNCSPLTWGFFKVLYFSEGAQQETMSASVVVLDPLVAAVSLEMRTRLAEA